MRQHAPARHSPYLQALVGVGVLLLALGLALGAWFIPSDTGITGGGRNEPRAKRQPKRQQQHPDTHQGL